MSASASLPTTPTKPIARHGMLATALLLAIGLVATSLSSLESAKALWETINEGQGELIAHTIRERARPFRGPESKAKLEEVFEEHEANGLRGIAIVHVDGELHTIAGKVSSTRIQFEGRPKPGFFRRVGDRIQVLVLPPPPRHDEASIRPPPMPIGLDEPPYLLEIEPTYANELIARQERTFALSTGVAAVLVVIAWLLWLRAQREAELAALVGQKERLAALGTMSAVLAHEIKNPLAALKGNAQLVAESLAEGTRTRAQADRVVDATLRLQSLVANLLNFVRAGSIERTFVDPAELLFLAAEDAAPGASLDLDEAPESWSLDALRIRQVLENLLRNAVQASKKSEAVHARVATQGGELVYTVSDEGPGFSEEAIGTVFEPFFTTKTRGVGLGLAVARRIVEMHGGTIRARNREEGGAELRVSIPRQG